MKHSNYFLQITLSTLFSLLSHFSFAGDIQPEGVTLSPMIGYLTHDDDKQQVKNTSTLSLAAGYQFNSPWAIELAYLSSEPDQVPSGDADSDQIRIDSLYHFGANGKLQPFALFGIGGSDIEGTDLDIDDTLLNAGLGVKYKLNNFVSLRSDVRAIQELDTEVTQMSVNLGLSIFFGDQDKKSSPIMAAAKTEPDSDKDGIIDRLDNCPSTPAGTKVDAVGCPLSVDNDKDQDGVIDSKDNCPDSKPHAKVDKNGCYQVLKEDVTIQLNVTFANNSDAVVSNAMQEIEPLADFMQQYPMTTVVIEGHTDSIGAEDYNKSLSQKRANAVAKILKDKFNISNERISAVGLGEAQPIASNDTAEGRAKNRRVEGVVKATVEKVIPSSQP